MFSKLTLKNGSMVQWNQEIRSYVIFSADGGQKKISQVQVKRLMLKQ